ncbi:prepilin peptidase [Xanthobacter sp. TB0139]|uniref:prepilin peptidase n=1 Tax=Xanthobacter sp. TB0139 TaxID=3459178 RepID=UPI004039898D
MTIEFVARLVFSLLMLLVLVWDARFLRIPDKLNLLVAGAFVPFAALQGLAWDVLLGHVGLAFFLFACFLAVAMLGPLGGGDVKLAGAVGLWIGSAPGVVRWLVAAGVIYAALLLIALMFRKTGLIYRCSSLRLPAWLRDLLSPDVSLRKAVIPFGVPLAAGAVYWAWI